MTTVYTIINKDLDSGELFTSGSVRNLSALVQAVTETYQNILDNGFIGSDDQPEVPVESVKQKIETEINDSIAAVSQWHENSEAVFTFPVEDYAEILVFKTEI